MSDTTEKVLQIFILGSTDSGKNNILNHYFHNEFYQNILTGIDYQSKYLRFDGVKVRVYYIDTAGQEKLKYIPLNYLKGIHGVLFLYLILIIEMNLNV